jgi:LEA14-like dessication related protein
MKKPLIIGLVTAVGVAGLLLYMQFKKLMDYKLSFRSIRVKKINTKELDLSLGLNFENKSDIQVVLTNQTYKIYINSVLISTVVSNKEAVIAAKSTTPLNFDVSVGSKGIGELLKTMNFNELLNINKQRLRVDSTIDVKVGSKVKTLNQSSEDLIENWKK